MLSKYPCLIGFSLFQVCPSYNFLVYYSLPVKLNKFLRGEEGGKIREEERGEEEKRGEEERSGEGVEER